jgi:hypothetical protein
VAIKASVSSGINLRASVSSTGLRIVAPTFRKASVNVHTLTLKAATNFLTIKTHAYYQYVQVGVQYQAIAASRVLLDPDSNNRYIRDDQVSFTDVLSFGSTKLLADAAVVADLSVIGVGKSATDSLDVSDIAAVTVQFARNFADQAGFVDAPIFVVGKAAFDVVAPTELLAVALDKPLQDTYSIADSLERVVDYNRAFTDFVAVDDNATVGGVEKDTQAVKTNIVAMVEEHLYSFGKVLSDVATVSESLANDFAKPVVDSAIVIDLAALQVNTGANDTITPTDNLARTVAYSREFADSVSLVDSAEKDTQASKANIVAMSEAHTYTFSKKVFDTISLAEAARRAVSKTLADSMSVTESLLIETTASRQSSILNAGAFNTYAFNN